MPCRCLHDPARVVARQPLFASLTPAECQALVSRSVCRGVSRHAVLFREGDPTTGLHLVVEGRVQVYRANARGQEQILGVFGPGDSLGDVSLFDEGPSPVSARALEDGRVLFLPFDQVHALYHTHPEVARAVVAELSARIRALTSLVDRLALRDVPSRVAGAVLDYARQHGEPRAGLSFRLPRTQQALASELGTTRESVARALRELRAAQLIGQRGAAVELLDPGRLAELAGGAALPRRAGSPAGP